MKICSNYGCPGRKPTGSMTATIAAGNSKVKPFYKERIMCKADMQFARLTVDLC